MGSKSRITNKLRQNDEYRAITRFLDGIGLRYSTHPPTGREHPFMQITLPNGAIMRHGINCTPSGGGRPKHALGILRRALRGAGYDVG
jgi:hypothetical protein